MVGFTIASVVKTPTGITVTTTTGQSVEFTGTIAEITDTLKAQVGDTDPMLALRMFMLRALHFDRNLDNPSTLANKVVSHDIRSATLLTVL